MGAGSFFTCIVVSSILIQAKNNIEITRSVSNNLKFFI
jgi:hypothetical protein